MLFIWEDGHTSRIDYGEQIRGLMRKCKRPLFIVVMQIEMDAYIPRSKDFSFYEYSLRVMSSLDLKGKLFFIKEPE